MTKPNDVIQHERNMRVLKDSTLAIPLDRETKMPTEYRRPFTGCWLFKIVNGKKHWCQSGSKKKHEGKKHNV